MNRAVMVTLGSSRRAAVTLGVLSTVVVVAIIFVPGIRDLTAILGVLGTAAAFFIRQYPNDAKIAWGRFLEHLAWVNGAIEREAIRNRVEGELSAGAAQLALSCPGASPAAVELEFLKSGEQVGELANGTLVIAIEDHRDHPANLARAAWAYARLAILRNSRHHLDPEVSQGINFVVARQILASSDRAAFAHFIEQLWRPAVEGHDRLRELTSKLERLQDDELFGPIVLQEFLELAARHANDLPDEVLSAETAAFVDFVHDLSTREHGKEGPLDFEGKSIRAKVIFVARGDVYALKGPDPYRKAVNWAIDHGFRNVYLLARGSHTGYAADVAATFVGDERVHEPVAWTAATARNNRLIPRSVVRIPVDVRYGVGIGQRLILTVGPKRTPAMDRQHFG